MFNDKLHTCSGSHVGQGCISTINIYFKRHFENCKNKRKKLNLLHILISKHQTIYQSKILKDTWSKATKVCLYCNKLRLTRRQLYNTI